MITEQSSLELNELRCRNDFFGVQYRGLCNMSISFLQHDFQQVVLVVVVVVVVVVTVIVVLGSESIPYNFILYLYERCSTG